MTNCFEEDRTPDLRGVEDMFLPVDDEETDAEILKKVGKGGMKKLKERERREAAKSVRDALGHWIGKFSPIFLCFSWVLGLGERIKIQWEGMFLLCRLICVCDYRIF